jgi:hypothetical protein
MVASSGLVRPLSIEMTTIISNLVRTSCALLFLSSLTACMHDSGVKSRDNARENSALFRGVTYKHVLETQPTSKSIHILELDLTDPDIKLIVSSGDRSAGMEYRAQTTSNFLVQNRLQGAVNGGYFLPFNGGTKGGDDYYPKAGDPVNVSGASVSHGVQDSPIEMDLDARVNAIVCISGKRVAIEDGQHCNKQPDFALAAGPRLLKKRQTVSFESNDPTYGKARHPRTALGIDAKGRRAWLVVVDGRQTGLSEGATLQELSEIFTELGASDAINLDGGGSTTMVVAETSGAKVLNSPIHTGIPGRERPSANHLGFIAAEKKN